MDDLRVTLTHPNDHEETHKFGDNMKRATHFLMSNWIEGKVREGQLKRGDDILLQF